MGMSNFEIERVFKNIDNVDLEKVFLGVFLSNKMSKLFEISKMMKEKNILL